MSDPLRPSKESMVIGDLRINIYWEKGYGSLYKYKNKSPTPWADYGDIRIRVPLEQIKDAMEALRLLEKKVIGR